MEKKRLSLNEKIHVKVPIRYGRRSGTKKNFTMVLSKDCENKSKLGTAYFTPFKNKQIKSFRGIENQARYLSEAEGSNDNKLMKGKQNEWCTIGIIFNPNLKNGIREKILEKWKNLLKKDGGLSDVSIYSSILSDEGEININWFRAVNKNEQVLIDRFDFALATCTRPTENPFPSEKKIAGDASVDARKYFYNNIRNGITTFQDREVVKELQFQ